MSELDEVQELVVERAIAYVDARGHDRNTTDLALRAAVRRLKAALMEVRA